MRTPLVIASIALGTLFFAGCGAEIGDECALSSDCSPQGDRFCDTASPGGYCTVIGCDHDTCPDDSVCIRFFTLAESNLTCSTDNDCDADDLCTLSGFCMPRSAEFRFCMRTCDSGGDCRDGYECRNEELMRSHGGEPVPKPGEDLPSRLPKFCAPAPQ